MTWTPVASSMIDAYDYDADMGVLHVRFANGQVYSYNDVPPQIAKGLAESQSPGRYFHSVIKGQYA